MRKALVLMMTTCILLAGCIEGLTEDVEEVVVNASVVKNNSEPIIIHSKSKKTSAA